MSEHELTPEQIAEGERLCREANLPWELWTGCSWRRFGSVGTCKTVIEPVTYSATDKHPDLHLAPGAAAFVEWASANVQHLLAAARREAELREACEGLVTRWMSDSGSHVWRQAMLKAASELRATLNTGDAGE